MPLYVKRGKIPKTRHTQHRNEKGELYPEELVSCEGFFGVYFNMYHHRPPTRMAEVGEFQPVRYLTDDSQENRYRHLETFMFAPVGNWVNGRRLIGFNNDVALMTATPNVQGEFFYHNGVGDEVIFVPMAKVLYTPASGVWIMGQETILLFHVE
jgi:homogentisate 1,2-dioxygenase